MKASKLEKAEKAIGPETKEELGALDAEGLKQRVVQANQAMEQAEQELEANPKFQALKEDLKALSGSKRDVNKRQKAIIAYALHLLEQQGAAQ